MIREEDSVSRGSVFDTLKFGLETPSVTEECVLTSYMKLRFETLILRLETLILRLKTFLLRLETLILRFETMSSIIKFLN